MPLFFKEKFGLSIAVIAIILTIHRFSLGIPMFFIGDFIKGNLKLIYIITLAIEGLMITLGGIIPNVLVATIVWLTHDLIGAAFWSPIQQTLMQQYSRENRRAEDISIVTGLQHWAQFSVPLLAGWLSGISISLPFIVSGIITMLASLILFKL